ncbi:histidinol-phosphate transaminase [Brevibacterium jeotgali]|uniref:Histidinol-phosphate aminotransferase n=1 Tax=Brevibacterium jeotgali TaxID=1262550 RepID=A0A2H1L1A7_9MICO|nr:histidinol-phosphate transaminase [Brevibacterium jeotgali]TWC01961.1 histidinol-phosphate aminotransferase [Brevibacterium jeotgali]SMY10688.1 histidinol-phosphate aminotransferase [Brevibacterium jeotgali]
MTNFRVRRSLADTPAYIPGRPPAAVEGMTSYKLSSNENHLAPLPAVVDAITGVSDTPALYPDPAGTDLTAALARFHDVATDQVVLSAGSSESLAALVGITLEPGAQVVYPWPSFEMYPQLTSFAGADRIAVPLDADGRHDLPGMAEAITDHTRLVLLCSPNNPTGTVLGDTEFDTFMSQVPEDLIVVLDEAYVEFADGSEAAARIRTPEGNLDAPVDAEQALATYSNLVVLRTFSKAHGLAGLRVGYSLAHPAIIHEMRKSIAPFSVGAAGQAAGLVSLAVRDEVLVRAKEVGAARDDLAARLREMGIAVPPSGGNFVWLPLGQHDSAAFSEACMARGLAVRNLGAGVRITVGPREAMERLVDVAEEFMRGRDA